MFTQLSKQMWFVCLMVFAVGWSGVSVASTKNMHLEMQIQHQQMMQSNSEVPNDDLSTNDLSSTDQSKADSVTPEHDMSKISVAQMKSHCQQMMEQNQNHTMSVKSKDATSTDLNDMALKASCMFVSDSGKIQHQQCPDCSLMACQAMIVWLNVAPVEFSQPIVAYQKQSSQHDYQAQHLAGHWQEILRPPKA